MIDALSRFVLSDAQGVEVKLYRLLRCPCCGGMFPVEVVRENGLIDAIIYDNCYIDDGTNWRITTRISFNHP
jgi:hypothetical protein